MGTSWEEMEVGEKEARVKEWGRLKVRVQLLPDVLQGTQLVRGNPASTFPSGFWL